MAQVATITPLNQFFSLNGSPLNNGKLYFGEATKDPEQFPITVYWDEAGTVPALQPIRTTSGYPSRNGSPAILYVDSIYSLRVRQSNDVQVYYIASTGSPPPVEPTPFVDTELVPSYASANSFTLTGDQTGEFQPGRRAQMTLGSGFVYGTITTAVYGALTTVTLAMDSTPLDASLSAVALSFFKVTPNALPPTIEYVNKQTGTTYAYLAGDQAKLITHTNAAAIAGTLPVATALPVGWWADVQNRGAGTLTITPTTSTIDGAATLVIGAGQGLKIISDGTNYFTVRPSLMTIRTAVTASGTAVNFTDIPAGTRRITMMCSGLSTNGTSNLILQIGDSGGIEIAGYAGAMGLSAAGSSDATTGTGTGYTLTPGISGAAVFHSMLVLVLTDPATNLWGIGGTMGRTDNAQGLALAGHKALSATLDRVRLTTVGGVDTFDAGTVNIMYEG